MAVPARRGRASARAILSMNRDLFGSPVRASWELRWVSSRCSERCSLTSRRVSTSPAIMRSPRRSRWLTRTWAGVPSGRLTSQSPGTVASAPSRIRANARATVSRSPGLTRLVSRVPATWAVPKRRSAAGVA